MVKSVDTRDLTQLSIMKGNFPDESTQIRGTLSTQGGGDPEPSPKDREGVET